MPNRNHLKGKLEKLNKQPLRLVYWDKISTNETLVVKNGYSTLANQRLAKMLKQCLEQFRMETHLQVFPESLTARNSNYNLRGDAI